MTITTCGYGDMFPVHPLARSLAGLEASFGQLFPVIFMSRLVALHLAHNGDRGTSAVARIRTCEMFSAQDSEAAGKVPIPSDNANIARGR